MKNAKTSACCALNCMEDCFLSVRSSEVAEGRATPPSFAIDDRDNHLIRRTSTKKYTNSEMDR